MILLQLEEKVKNSEARAGADARVIRSQLCPSSEQFSAQLHIYLGACRGISGLLYPDVTLWQAVYFPDILQIRERVVSGTRFPPCIICITALLSVSPQSGIAPAKTTQP